MESKEQLEEENYSCFTCNKEFKTLVLFNRHKKNHNLSCEKCSQSFQTFNQLRQHSKETHPKLKFYKCKVCPNLTFNIEKEYLLHLRNDHEGKIIESHMCSVCGKTFRTSSELTLHIRSKCGTEKQFICKECGQKLMSPGSLYTHLKRHKGEHSFMCRFCAKLFLTSGQLKVHERIHTQQKVFICDVCGKGFCHRQSLITHISVHTGIKPYQCEGCGKSFSCVGNLLKHRRTHADTCGAIPMTSHRVQNPSTKTKVRINTPLSSKLKRMQMKKELEEKFANLGNDTTNEEIKTEIKDEKVNDTTHAEIIHTEEKNVNEEYSANTNNAEIDSGHEYFSEKDDENSDYLEENNPKIRKRRKRNTISVQEEDIENFISVRKLVKGKTATCTYCKKEYSNFKWLYKHEQDHIENNVKDEILPPKCCICQRSFETQTELKTHQEEYHKKELYSSWTSSLQNGLQQIEKQDIFKRHHPDDFIMKYSLQIQNNNSLLHTLQKQLCCGLSVLDKIINKVKQKEETENVNVMDLIDSTKIFADLFYIMSKKNADDTDI